MAARQPPTLLSLPPSCLRLIAEQAMPSEDDLLAFKLLFKAHRETIDLYSWRKYDWHPILLKLDLLHINIATLHDLTEDTSDLRHTARNQLIFLLLGLPPFEGHDVIKSLINTYLFLSQPPHVQGPFSVPRQLEALRTLQSEVHAMHQTVNLRIQDDSARLLEVEHLQSDTIRLYWQILHNAAGLYSTCSRARILRPTSLQDRIQPNLWAAHVQVLEEY